MTNLLGPERTNLAVRLFQHDGVERDAPDPTV
jgi:hypothetical protein